MAQFFQRQWDFDAAVRADDIRIGGPEKNSPDRDTYSAVGLDELDVGTIHPLAVTQLVAQYHGVWPASFTDIDETYWMRAWCRRPHVTPPSPRIGFEIADVRRGYSIQGSAIAQLGDGDSPDHCLAL